MPEKTATSRDHTEGAQADIAAQRRVAEARAWYLQRISAMVLTLFVIIHLAVMVFAIHGGLSAAEILSRTRSSPLVGVFYGLFVIACAVHVPIGVAKPPIFDASEMPRIMAAAKLRRLASVSGKSRFGTIALIAARAIGSIITVVAELLTHIETIAVTAMTANNKDLGSGFACETTKSATRR